MPILLKIEMQYFDGQGKNSILLYLMAYPDKNILKYFIEELKLDINIFNLYKRNALYFLIDSINQIVLIENNISLIKDTFIYLINKGINIEQIDYLGNNPFLYLCKNNFNKDLLNILYENKCDINRFNNADENSLFYYLRKKDYEKVKTLIEEFKVDYKIKDTKKRTIMHYLCNDEIPSTDMDERLCDYLLSKNVHLNSEDILGRTPIHYLFVKINDEYNSNDIDPVNTLTKFLEFKEVDPEHQDIYGNTPLHYACQRGSIISIITLGSKGVNYDSKNKENNSPLSYSLLFKKENIAINLIQQNVDLDQYAYCIENRNEKKKIEEIMKNNNNDIIKLPENDLDSSFELENEENEEIMNAENKEKMKIEVETLKKNEKIEEVENDKINKENNLNEKKMDIENDNIDDNVNDNNNSDNSDDDNDDENTEEISQSNNLNNNQNQNISNNNFINPFGFNNNNFRRNPKMRALPNIINNRNSYYGSNYNSNNRNISYNTCPDFILNLFTKKKKSIKLFRLCIKNNFQGLTHLFITRGYSLMKGIEDSFYEHKFNLAMKLLQRSPYNNTYQTLNNKGQNLFHILGHIRHIHNISELPKFFDLLYSKEIPLDAKDNFGNTPLHYAAKNLFQQFIEFIINKFEDKNYIINLENKDNHTPFYYATSGNNINVISKDIFNLLLTSKNIDQMNTRDESLINKINSINKKNKYKSSLLLFIIRLMLKEPKDLLKYFYSKLIEKGASIMQNDSYGKSALIYSILENDFNILQMLCNDCGNNIDKNIIDESNKKSLIHYCISINNFGSYENKEMLSYLIDNNFQIYSKDISNKTPLDYSLEQKTLNNFKILKQKNIQGTENIDIDKYVYSNSQEEFDEKKCNEIPVMDYEKDSKEYYNKMIQSLDESKYIKKPNLRDYQSEFYELYKENGEYWDASLTKVNLQNGIYGEYMFYFIQLVHDLGKNIYIVTTQFGRIGEEGANQRSPFNTLDEAKNEFCKIFKSKTSNSWLDKNNFQRVKGKYMLLTYNKIQLSPNELLKPFDYKKCKQSNLANNELQNLIKSFTDCSIIEKAFKDTGVDTEFFNFSSLNKDILLKARSYLLSLYEKVQELEKIRNINVNMNNFNNNFDKKENNDDMMDIEDNEENKKNKEDKIKDIKDIKTLKDKTEAIIFKTNEIMDLSNRYYELIPKEKYKNRCILPLDRINDVKNEIQIIDNLTYVEKAVNILLGANNKLNEINPLDYIYYSLQTYFDLIEKQTPEYNTLEKYINNTSKNDKIINIFRVTRKGETEKINKFNNLSNHYLLFHGTKIFNLIGIFSNGLKIAPPEAPSTGYMFGKGVYFADMYEKSISYCDTIKDKSNPKKIKSYSYILLCEAALGNIYQPNISNINFENLSFLNEGYNSLKSLSNSGPDPNKNFISNNGITIPLGNIITYNNNNNNYNMSFVSYNMFRTSYPEYVVYNTEQIKIRYIVQIERDSNEYY